MIRGILFTLFAILLVAAIAVTIFLGVRAYQSNGEKGRKGHRNGSIATGIVALGFAALLICIPGSFHQVETGTVAVVRHLGKIQGTRAPGTYFDFYMVNSYEVFDAKVQQDKINTMAYSKDGQTMELEVFLQYQVQQEHIVDIATQYGNLDALQSRIETQTIEKTKAVMSSAEAMTIIQNRAQFSNDVSDAVRLALDENAPRKGDDGYWYIADNGRLINTNIEYHEQDVCEVRNGYWFINDTNTGIRYNSYYVDVRDVVLTNIDFSDEFEKSVEDKVIAEQEKQAAITRAEAELEVAKLEAQKKIEEARGNAEAQKILAQASAEAATYKIIELAKTLGYDVTETYIYSVTTRDTDSNVVSVLEKAFTEKQYENDDTVFIGTKYVIDITSGPGAEKFKSLVEDYLQYLAYLEQWNGELPDVVAGDDALSIIVPGGN